MKLLRRILVALLLGVALVGCAGLPPLPGGDSVARVLELNRAGEWRRAARTARRLLDADPAPALGERCEAAWGLAYAYARLGDSEAAAEALDLFDRQCGELPAETWVWREVENLRAGLGPADEGGCAGSHDDGFWQVADGPSLGLSANALAFHLALCKRTGADAYGRRRLPGGLPGQDRAGVVLAPLPRADLCHVEHKVGHRPADRHARR